MIEARRAAWFAEVVRRLVCWRMRGVFHGVFVMGEEFYAALPAGRAVLACANHTNYWDGWVALVVTARIGGREGYVMQEERHLRRYPFLRYAGAFGVELGGARAAVAGTRYALGLLARPATCLWVFPQGRIEHPCAPVEVRAGAAYLSKKSGAPILPLAFCYEWSTESRPGIYVGVGEALEPGAGGEELAGAIGAVRDRVRGAVCGRRFGEFRPVQGLRLSMARRWDRVVHWLRGGGEFDPRTP